MKQTISNIPDYSGVGIYALLGSSGKMYKGEYSMDEQPKVSKAQQKAVHKYVKNNYDRIEVTVPKGKKDIIKAHAESKGESVNGFINRAIDEEINSVSCVIELTCLESVRMFGGKMADGNGHNSCDSVNNDDPILVKRQYGQVSRKFTLMDTSEIKRLDEVLANNPGHIYFHFSGATEAEVQDELKAVKEEFPNDWK